MVEYDVQSLRKRVDFCCEGDYVGELLQNDLMKMSMKSSLRHSDQIKKLFKIEFNNKSNFSSVVAIHMNTLSLGRFFNVKIIMFML